MNHNPKYLQRSFLILVLAIILAARTDGQSFRRVVSDAERQALLMLKEVEKALEPGTSPVNSNKHVVAPRSLTPEGELLLVLSADWTSGFFSGNLWLLSELTGNLFWADKARLYTSKIEKEKLNGTTHDMGFKIYCSFGTGYRLQQDPVYKEIIVESAKTLATRFNPVTGCLRSWDHSKDKWEYPVIIDNMMNLELLFAATRLTGDSSFYKIAVSHAGTTLENHFRQDHSSYHVIGYDPITGQVLHRNTHQGLNDESSWARGQAWGLYGYTMCFRETGDTAYLEQAENIAGYILNHPKLPDDFIPYWDYSLENVEGEPRDASAAAITASALLELSRLSENGSYYRKTAEMIIRNLTRAYRSAPGKNRGFILDHSTGNKNRNLEVDSPLIYADYYFLEALVRQREFKQRKQNN